MILVTGGTGIVGARVLYDLASSGRRVKALRRASSTNDTVNMVFSGQEKLLDHIEWVEGSITDIYDVMEAMKEVDEVYHCAAKVSFHGSDQREILKVNAEGTANMVNMSIEQGVKKFCHVSSIAALGRVEENKVMDENVHWKSSKYNSLYAVSKYNAEREVWRAMEEGLNAMIVSPAIIIGPGNWKTGSSAMFSRIWKGMKFYSEGVNGFVDVRDVSKCMLGLMERNIFGERFILNSENCSYGQIFNIIAECLNKPVPTIKVDRLMSEVGWRVESLRTFFTRKEPFITKETAQNSQMKWFYSNEKIKKALGISFIPVRQSIEDCAKIFIRSHSKEVQHLTL